MSVTLPSLQRLISEPAYRIGLGDAEGPVLLVAFPLPTRTSRDSEFGKESAEHPAMMLYGCRASLR